MKTPEALGGVRAGGIAISPSPRIGSGWIGLGWGLVAWVGSAKKKVGAGQGLTGVVPAGASHDMPDSARG